MGGVEEQRGQAGIRSCEGMMSVQQGVQKRLQPAVVIACVLTRQPIRGRRRQARQEAGLGPC